MYLTRDVSQATHDANGLPFNAVRASVTSYDSFNNPLVVLYYDKYNNVIRTATLTYDGTGRFLNIVYS